jgi:hypothetical protein
MPATSWVGLALGVVGALLLALEGDFSASGLGALLAFGALCWSIGSYASQALAARTGHGLGRAVAHRRGHGHGGGVDGRARGCIGRCECTLLAGLGVPAGPGHAGGAQLPVAAAEHLGRTGGELLLRQPGRGAAGGRGPGASSPAGSLRPCPDRRRAGLAAVWARCSCSAAQRLRARMPGDHAGGVCSHPTPDSTHTMLYKFKSVPRPT